MRSHRPRGFTLVELAVVAGVLAVLVGVVLPNVIAGARTQLGLKAIEEIRRIQDGAVLYFHNSAPEELPYEARWPGQTGRPPPFECSQGATTLADLRTANINLSCGAAPDAICNPWAQPYLVSIAGTNLSCNFRVITYVPNGLQAMFAGAGGRGSHVPQGACGIACSTNLRPGGPVVAPPAGFVACCSTITRPGLESSLDSYHPSLEDLPPATASSYCDQLNRDPAMGYVPGVGCRINSAWSRYDCGWYSGRCPSNRSGVGTNGSSPPRVLCCKTTN